MDIYLVRHTTLTVEKGLCYGQADIPLAPTFLQEATDTAKQIAEKQRATYISSPSRRCTQLAANLGRRPPITDRRLLELNFGQWELKLWETLDTDQVDAWLGDIINTPCPGGEAYADLYGRVIEFFLETLHKNHHSIVITTHAGVIRCILAYVLEMPLQRAFDIRLAYGGVSKISSDGDVISVDFINRI
ncbi:alpha-ribazole phosphatase [Ignavibacteria bacterium]|nr:alpha-ribazole phosphatase [Bacteroidota bacterium]MCZ2132053.1 alpha-ribazole phosphatase [Bacteroidota bacterium]